MNIKKNDKVTVIAGKYKGQQGEVHQIFTKKKQVIIKNINLKIKHIKPKEEGKKGAIKKIEAPIHISNVAIIS